MRNMKKIKCQHDLKRNFCILTIRAMQFLHTTEREKSGCKFTSLTYLYLKQAVTTVHHILALVLLS